MIMRKCYAKVERRQFIVDMMMTPTLTTTTMKQRMTELCKNRTNERNSPQKYFSHQKICGTMSLSKGNSYCQLHYSITACYFRKASVKVCKRTVLYKAI